MGVDEIDPLGAGDTDDTGGHPGHEQELAREGQTPARPPRSVVCDPVHLLAAVGVRALLGRRQDHRIESQALLERHDAAAPVAVAAPDGQRVVEDVERARGRPARHGRAPSATCRPYSAT